MNPQIALTSIVTKSMLDEFIFLKFSFELFHGTGYQWFIRCDRESLPALSAHSNIISTEFVESIRERPYTETPQFHHIMGEKMNAMADAWDGGDWAGVIFFDADIIITSPVMTSLSEIEGEVILAPNYHFSEDKKRLDSVYGYYNGGFALTRSRRFSEWWQEAYKSRPVGWADQICLNDAPQKFAVGTLSERANIGFWRSGNFPEYDAIPINCEFLHAHLFQPLRTQRQWIDKSFALHCLKFLRQSPIREHRILFDESLIRDTSGWYEASLRLC